MLPVAMSKLKNENKPKSKLSVSQSKMTTTSSRSFTYDKNKPLNKDVEMRSTIIVGLSKYLVIFLIFITAISSLLIHLELKNHDEGLIKLIYKYTSEETAENVEKPVSIAKKSSTNFPTAIDKKPIKNETTLTDLNETVPIKYDISEEKLLEIEDQIISNDDKSEYLKEDIKSPNRDENLRKKELFSNQISELYNEVERLTEEILKDDPDNDMIKELAPHLEGVLRDMNSKKMNGIEKSLLHIREILTDLKERLEDVKKIKTLPTEPERPNQDYKYGKKLPVDEVIPDPIYIAPRGVIEETLKDEVDQHESRHNLDQIEEASEIHVLIDQKASKSEIKHETNGDEVLQMVSENIIKEDKVNQVVSESDVNSRSIKALNIEISNVQIDSLMDEVQNRMTQESVIKKDELVSLDPDYETIKEAVQESKSTKPEVKEDSLKVKVKLQVPKDEVNLGTHKDETRPEITKHEDEEKLAARMDEEKLETPKNEVKIEAKKEELEQKTHLKREILNEEVRHVISKDEVKLDMPKDELKDKLSKKEMKNTPTENEAQHEASKNGMKQEIHKNDLKREMPKDEVKHVISKDEAILRSTKDELESEILKARMKDEIKLKAPIDDVKSETPMSEIIHEAPKVVEKAETPKNEVKHETLKDEVKDKSKYEVKHETTSNEKHNTAKVEVSKDSPIMGDQNNYNVQFDIDLASSLILSNPAEAVNIYERLLLKDPECHKILLGKARALKNLAEKNKSNHILEKCIAAYRFILYLAEKKPSSVPDDVLKIAGLEAYERMDFRGQRKSLINMMLFLVKRFPNDVELGNKLGVSFLYVDSLESALEQFNKVLEIDANNTFGIAHVGYVLHQLRGDCVGAINQYRKLSDDEGDSALQSRFFLHYGDCLGRTGDREAAQRLYEEGSRRGYFLSKNQRSVHNVNGLKSHPTWTLEETTYKAFFQSLEKNWKKILSEGLSILESQTGLVNDLEKLLDRGEWSQFTLFSSGKMNEDNCKRAPFTCSLIKPFAPAANNKRGQVKFSILYPGTHVHPHTGPTNCRLRGHLGLAVPKSGAKLRIVDQIRTWNEGKMFVFDDSFEHEVWHDGEKPRIILIVDVYHPQLTDKEKQTMSPI